MLFYLQINGYIDAHAMEAVLITVFSVIFISNLIMYEIGQNEGTLKKLSVTIASVIYPGTLPCLYGKVDTVPIRQG